MVVKSELAGCEETHCNPSIWKAGAGGELARYEGTHCNQPQQLEGWCRRVMSYRSTCAM